METRKLKLGLPFSCFIFSLFYFLVASPLAAAQFARPSADVSAGLYTTTPLWEKLDDVTADDDTTEILSANNPVESDGTGFEVRLSALSDPQTSSGHTLRFRAQKQTGGRTLDVSCRLYQGTTAISPVRTLTNLGTTYTTHTYTLAAGEADAISDYSDLRMRCWSSVSGGGSATSAAFTWIELETPDAPPSQSKPFLLVVSE